MSELATVIIGMTSIGIIVGLVMFVLNAIAEFKIFKKAGEAGWKAWIPFYNTYVQYRFSWKTSWFWILMALIVVSTFFGTKGAESDTYATLSTISLAAIWVVQLIGSIKLAKAFGKGTIYGILMGITFLQTILFFVLAYGKSKYIGNSSIK